MSFHLDCWKNLIQKKRTNRFLLSSVVIHCFLPSCNQCVTHVWCDNSVKSIAEKCMQWSWRMTHIQGKKIIPIVRFHRLFFESLRMRRNDVISVDGKLELISFHLRWCWGRLLESMIEYEYEYERLFSIYIVDVKWMVESLCVQTCLLSIGKHPSSFMIMSHRREGRSWIFSHWRWQHSSTTGLYTSYQKFYCQGSLHNANGEKKAALHHLHIHLDTTYLKKVAFVTLLRFRKTNSFKGNK